MKISDLLTDKAILIELGARVAHCRLERQMTQAEVAEQAGVGKRTVERIEAGASAQMASLIRVLRALGMVSALDRLLPEVAPRPMDLLKREGRMRQRASSGRSSARSKTPWSWDDET